MPTVARCPSTSSSVSSCDGTTAGRQKPHQKFMLRKWSRFDRLKGNQGKVVLLGDSVLDTFYFLRNPKRDLRNIMEEKLQKHANLVQKRDGGSGDEGLGESQQPVSPWTCLNFAVEQMTTFDLMDRGIENDWHKCQTKRAQVFGPDADPLDHDGYEHLVGPDGRIRSIDNLSYLKNVKHAFLALGGNDVYLSRDVQFSLASSLIPFNDKRGKVAENMAVRLRRILDSIARKCPDLRVTLVICYQPHNDYSISGLTGCAGNVGCSVQRHYLAWMVTPAVRKLLELAAERGLDVIDLSQTCDPDDETHYGNQDKTSAEWCGAECSDVAQVFTSNLLMEVLHANTVRDPTTPPRCFWGKTQRTNYLSTHAVALTPSNIDAYSFTSGFRNVTPMQISSPVPKYDR
eukprot:TRINITY_DN6169_c1_g3_i1.p1 TRINITY_DN6169_c1_g3~~TRINITY_DN6169_c1_g3_i1.p1  ORF type:complete len:401 (+),score=163.26 TRINITY_DN6169_c1_g3_i1:1317-2519(+)